MIEKLGYRDVNQAGMNIKKRFVPYSRTVLNLGILHLCSVVQTYNQDYIVYLKRIKLFRNVSCSSQQKIDHQ